MLYAGVDLGGTKVACALGDAERGIVVQRTIPTQSWEGAERVLERVGELIRELSAEAGEDPSSLGMGVPGLADPERGVTLRLPNLPDKWHEVPVRAILSPLVGCPVHLINDVRAATLAELTFGLGRTAHTMAFFAIGTGIGGGIVVDGKLRLGPLGAAGELGHQTILPDGPRCGCGSRGCLEALAGGSAILAQGVRLMKNGEAPHLHDLTGGDLNRLNAGVMAEAAGLGDEAVRRVLVRCAAFIGIAVANVVVTLHPDLVVLGGGVSRIGPLLFDTVRATLRERVQMIPTDDIRVEPSQLGEDAGVLGALAYASSGGQLQS